LPDQTFYGTLFGQEAKPMKITEDIKPITYLKSKTADMFNQINETHRPVIITQNGEARAVLQDPESYERMKSAIGLMKLLGQGEEDVRVGRTREQNDVFSRLKTKIKSRKQHLSNES
jgi:prevent-host-death family protein